MAVSTLHVNDGRTVSSWKLFAKTAGLFRVKLQGSKGCADINVDFKENQDEILKWSKYQSSLGSVVLQLGAARCVYIGDSTDGFPKYEDRYESQTTDCGAIADPGEVILISVSCDGRCGAATDNYTLDMGVDDSGKTCISIAAEMLVIDCSFAMSSSGPVVTCVGLSGDELCVVPIKTTATVQELREMISKKLNRPATVLKLVTKDAVLDDDTSLADFTA